MTAQQNNSVLNGIQHKIDACFLSSFSSKSDVYKSLQDSLEDGVIKAKTDNLKYYYSYWSSYLLYYKSITYIKKGDDEKAKLFVASAIRKLEGIKNKDVEVYSLLALEQSYNFQFIPRQEFIVYMNRVKNNLEKAITLAPDNVRANYVNGSYDFYTPKEYGGGRKTEFFLMKAIESADKNHLYKPTWGRSSAYDLLIQYYLNNNSIKQAKKYLNIALDLFPDDVSIKHLKTRINDTHNRK